VKNKEIMWNYTLSRDKLTLGQFEGNVVRVAYESGPGGFDHQS